MKDLLKAVMSALLNLSCTLDLIEPPSLHPTLKKQDHILLSWLLSSLSERVLGTVVDYSTSCEVWTTLANQFGARTRARMLCLMTHIQTTKKGPSTIHDYYSKMKTMLNALRAVGNNMSEMILLCVCWLG